MGIKFSDILALAKNGYSPKDIKDLMSLATEENTSNEGVQEKKVEEPTEPIVQKEEAEVAPAKQEPEYINRISELEAKNKELEDQIKEMQKKNTRKQIPEKEDTTEQDLDDLFRDYMS